MIIKRALLSVSDKTGLVDLAKFLQERGVSLISTGGTARHLREAGLTVQDVSELTGFPEMLDGRVKTLHPAIHGGILALRADERHVEQIQQAGILPVDMVVVNLYPFAQVIRKKRVDFQEAIENIDIGGPAMLRSAAKNFRHVAVVCRPERYKDVIRSMETHDGGLPEGFLLTLALEAFTHTAAYDRMIAEFLRRHKKEKDEGLPDEISWHLGKQQDLRYGENPHQRAAFYVEENQKNKTIFRQRQGKALSFNNILDLNAAMDVVRDLDGPGAVIIKHNNPTGVAEASSLALAYHRAWKADPLSAFGGIIGFNRRVDEVTAKRVLRSGFMECVVAPGFDKGALAILSVKKNLRLLELGGAWAEVSNEKYDVKKVHGGFLLQERDQKIVLWEDLIVVTGGRLTKAQRRALLFGWRVVKHIRSNAIVLVKGTRTVGIGAGQTSRVQSLAIAIQKAGDQAVGSVMISDAFLPHVDNVQLAAEAGIKVIMQTGGSIADKAVIAEAEKAGIVMVMTGVRHFKH